MGVGYACWIVYRTIFLFFSSVGLLLRLSMCLSNGLGEISALFNVKVNDTKVGNLNTANNYGLVFLKRINLHVIWSISLKSLYSYTQHFVTNHVW
ncbi:hypothetical protein CLU79DRAFT_765230 [Phycomyces nitens]|nr:hypothetical protein CLU79DRAFT_765230 [Phycomyces nitens]